VDDGIDALMKILENKGDCCKGQIINIGNPNNECSIRDLAHLLKQIFMSHPKHRDDKVFSEVIEASSDSYYGKGYQDITTRKPSIEKAKALPGVKAILTFKDIPPFRWHADMPILTDLARYEGDNIAAVAAADEDTVREAIDLITVTDTLKRSNDLDAVGGVTYLSSLVTYVPTAANVRYHSKIVKDRLHGIGSWSTA
jgi:hypothetical protein